MRVLVVMLGLLAGPAMGQAVPATAPVAAPDARAASLFEAQERRAPASTAATGAGVVTSADPRASAVGAAVLRDGGTAVDAAVATALALTVVEPQSSGIGGGGFAMYQPARGQLVAIDGRETAPAAARPDLFLGPDGKPLPLRQVVESGRSVGVPGLVAMLARLHAEGGRLPWARLVEPSVALARDGITVSPRLARILAARAGMIRAGAPRFFGPDGAPLKAGERLVQPEMAAAFERLKTGPQGFYAGETARQVAAAVAGAPRMPVPMTVGDLADYRAVTRAPVCAPYRGWRVCSMAPPSGGGVAMAQMLGMLARHDLGRMGPDDPLAWHLFAEATRLALADRAGFSADPGFVAVPTDGLTDPAYVAGRGSMIRLDRAMPAPAPGLPPGSAPAEQADAAAAMTGTSHMAAADAAGNVVSLTATIESIFGSGLTASGFFLNNQLTDFSPALPGRAAHNAPAPGKRPRSAMSPVILYGPDGRVAGAFGAAGGATIIPQVAKTVIGVVDWGLSVEDAVALPMLFATGDRFAYEAGPRFDRMVATWKALGHVPQAADLPTKTNALARVPGGWRGAGDPRSEGQAVAAGGRR